MDNEELSDEPPELKYYTAENDKNDFQNRYHVGENGYLTPNAPMPTKVELTEETPKETKPLAVVKEEGEKEEEPTVGKEEKKEKKEEPTKKGNKKKGKKKEKSTTGSKKENPSVTDKSSIDTQAHVEEGTVVKPLEVAPNTKALVTSLSFYPFAYALLDDECARHCWFCLKEKLPFDEGFELKKCSACNAARFCNELCQRRAWVDHKAECHAIRSVGGIPDVEARLLGRIMYRHKMIEEGKDKDDYFYIQRTSQRHVMELTSHSADIRKDSAAMAKFEALYARLHNFYQPRHMLDKEVVFELHCRNYINRHAISDVDYNREIGKGLYLDLCAYNHSCRPNAVFSCNGVKATLRALGEGVDLEDRSTTHYTYIDLLTAKQPRQKLLRDTWYFDCACERCVDDGEQILTAIKCRGEEGCDKSVVLFGKQCDKTPTTMTTRCSHCHTECGRGAITDALAFMKHVDDTVDGEGVKEEEIDEMLSKAERVLAKENVYLTRVYQRAIRFTDKGYAEKLLELHIKALPCLSMCYPVNHPTLAQLHHTIGRLYAAHKEEEHARSHGERAVDMFAQCLGGEHPKTIFVRQSMEEGQKVVNEHIIFKS